MAKSVQFLLVLLLLACRPRVGTLQGVEAPASGAWPEEPLAVLIEHNPWAMVIGAGTPRAEIFTDGTIIRLDAGGPARKPQLLVSQLTPAELARVKKAIRPAASLWRLKDDYNLAPNVTDRLTTELVVSDGKRMKRIQIYGYSADERQGGMAKVLFLPREVDRICRLLIALKPAHEVAWSPRYVEVMIWPYEYSPDEPLDWPEHWPALTSPMAFQQGDSWSLILPGAELPALEAFVAQRGERQAIRNGGKKWAIAYRPVMPGGRWAREIATRQQVTLTPLSGCYRTEWKSANPFPRYRDANFLPPETFELTTVPTEPGAQQFAIKGAREGQEFMFAEWEVVSAKEATLTWSTGFVGFTISVSLPATEGVLNGVATTFSDVPEKPDIAKVRLIRIAC